MNRFVFLFALLLLVANMQASAQDSIIPYRNTHVILKFAPFSLLLDPDATLQGGLEVRTGQRSSVQAEVGFGHKGLSVTSDEKKHFNDWSIWRVQSEWRHYTGRFKTSKLKNIHIRSSYPLGNYIAVEGFVKQIRGSKTIRLYNADSVLTDAPQSINRLVWGSRVKWGRQIAIPGESLNSLSRVLLDMYIGIGLLYGNTQLNPGTDICGCGFVRDRFSQGSAIQPSVTAGVKIGFGF